jgi:GH24 family phage-related lysozyme (muramidase)
MRMPSRQLNWPIPYEAVCEIARSEGLKLEAYLCPAGVPTIFWGRTVHGNGQPVRLGDFGTNEQADLALLEDLTKFASGVQKRLTMPATTNQLGAMTSFAYNVGLGGFGKSTVLRQHNAGNFQAAARAFALWNKAGGKVLNGLTKRRAREAALYLTPEASEQPEYMPQRVDPESEIQQSPIAQSGAISLATGLVATAAALIDPVADVASKLAIDPLTIIGVIAIIVGVAVMVQRKKQRSEGWA